MTNLVQFYSLKITSFNGTTCKHTTDVFIGGASDAHLPCEYL